MATSQPASPASDTTASLASSPTLTTESCSPVRPTIARTLSNTLSINQNTLTGPIPSSSSPTSPQLQNKPHENHDIICDNHDPEQQQHHHHHHHHHDLDLHDLVDSSSIDGGLKGWLA
ncbi:hypothetical protein BG004_006157, partial [Podila humilis]